MYTIGLLSTDPSAAETQRSLGLASFAIPLCFNFIVTGLIVGRIWYKGRNSTLALQSSGGVRSRSNHIQHAMAILIESGMLYFAVQFVETVLQALGHPAQILVAFVATQIYVRIHVNFVSRFLSTFPANRVSHLVSFSFESALDKELKPTTFTGQICTLTGAVFPRQSEAQVLVKCHSIRPPPPTAARLSTSKHKTLK